MLNEGGAYVEVISIADLVLSIQSLIVGASVGNINSSGKCMRQLMQGGSATNNSIVNSDTAAELGGGNLLEEDITVEDLYNDVRHIDKAVKIVRHTLVVAITVYAMIFPSQAPNGSVQSRVREASFSLATAFKMSVTEEAGLVLK